MDTLTRNLMMAAAAQGGGPTMPVLLNVANGFDADGNSTPTVIVPVSLGTAQAGRLLLVTVHMSPSGTLDDGQFISDFKCDGVSMTEIAAARLVYGTSGFPFGGIYGAFWIVNETSSGTTNFQVTGGGPGWNWPAQIRIAVFEFAGADNGSPIGIVQTRAASGTNQNFSITTGSQESYIISSLGGATGPCSPASGLTELFDDVPGDGGIMFAWGAARQASAPGSYAAGCTITAFFGFEGAMGAAFEIKGA